jgi:murein DD-endopeptidase MepM/ murein hydrolase activator NlpD
MANYYEDEQHEWATPHPNGGCLSGFIIIPIAVIAVSIALFSALSQIGTTTGAAVTKAGTGGNPETFVSPYEAYTLTQGPHGYSYGHMAIDIAAGEGATLSSPIHGVVTELFVDSIGNPTIIIENEIYRVLMMHGVYHTKIGEKVKSGQPIGEESNLGNTTDMQGRSCRNRDCGYHTHLNVYDKRIDSNVNPLDLLDP